MYSSRDGDEGVANNRASRGGGSGDTEKTRNRGPARHGKTDHGPFTLASTFLLPEGTKTRGGGRCRVGLGAKGGEKKAVTSIPLYNHKVAT